LILPDLLAGIRTQAVNLVIYAAYIDVTVNCCRGGIHRVAGAELPDGIYLREMLMGESKGKECRYKKGFFSQKGDGPLSD
jgi:hypothetical protein